MNNLVLLLGSNIEPEKNINAATDLLGNITAKSQIWQTKSFGSAGPDFLNIAVELNTRLDTLAFKKNIIRPIEKKLKRIRTANKYAPRTIDIDIMVFNSEVVDQDIWEKTFAAIPVSELRPDIIGPNGQKLRTIAKELKSSAGAELFIPITK